MRIILQCGLAKTGTTFLQRKLYSQIDLKKDGILYNPRALINLIIKAMNSSLSGGKLDAKHLEDIRQCLNEIRKNYEPRIVFCSYEPFGGGTAAWSFPDRMKILKEILPEAEIIVTFRYQTDWLQSLYKQHIHHASNPYIGPARIRAVSSRKLFTIEEFLNYNDGKFGQHNPSFEYANVDIHHFDWSEWIKELYDNFCQENVHIFFYEEFCKMPEKFVKRLINIFDGPESRIDKEMDFNVRYNSGFSENAIKLTRIKVYLASFFPKLLLLKKLDVLILNFIESIQQHNSSHKFYENVVVKIRVIIRKTVMFFSWLNIMRTYDRIFKGKKDLLEVKIRNQMDKEFRQMNENLSKMLSEDVIVTLPEEYTNFVSGNNFNKVKSCNGN